MALADAGTRWWEWAWHTPQAVAWDPGALYVVARRATLEDDLDAIGSLESLDALVLAGAENDRVLRSLVERLAALAANRLTICREMRELDKVLGLTPKAMADLRWSVASSEPESKQQAPASVRRLHAVDPSTVSA